MLQEIMYQTEETIADSNIAKKYIFIGAAEAQLRYIIKCLKGKVHVKHEDFVYNLQIFKLTA